MTEEVKAIEMRFLNTWKESGFKMLYRYKGRITGKLYEGSTSFELLYDIESEYFADLKDIANDLEFTYEKRALSVETMIQDRLGLVTEETKMDRKLRREVKFALRQASAYMKRFGDPRGVVLINWYNYEAHYFQDRQAATDHLLKEMKEWESVSAGEDEELEVITFCSKTMKESQAKIFDQYKPFRKINGEMVYRRRHPVKFEEVVEYYPSF